MWHSPETAGHSREIVSALAKIIMVLLAATSLSFEGSQHPSSKDPSRKYRPASVMSGIFCFKTKIYTNDRVGLPQQLLLENIEYSRYKEWMKEIVSVGWQGCKRAILPF